MGIRYYRKLTIKENAEKNACSVSAIKLHLQKLNLSASKARRANIIENITNAKDALGNDGIKPTVRSVCELTNLSNKTVMKYWKGGEQRDMSKTTPRSYSFTQTEILQNIIGLYCNTNDTIQCDLTFSSGKMWKGLKQPEYIFDLKPQLSEVRQLDEVRQYNNYFSSCMIDLPFIIRPQSESANSLICNRFDAFLSEKELLVENTNMLVLAWQILKPKSICIIKTQDTNYANKQIWTHRYIMNEAERIGYRVEDVFICLSKNMLVSSCKSSIHARKQHCYFIVLRKMKNE